MLRELFADFMIISGSERMVGKTFLGSALIRSFSDKFPLLALKISPHVHNMIGNTKMRSSVSGIRIFQDMEHHHKSSGMFLESGALQSFFMETNDEHLSEALDIFMRECNPLRHPVICESGALGRLIKPGILIFITNSTDNLPAHKLATMLLADLVLPAKTFSPPDILQRINFSEKGWYLVQG